MSRRPAHVPLNVFVNGRHVGTLRRASSGGIDFRYDRNWLDWSAAFPISLSLPLREDRYVGGAVSNVFDNLLPDSDAIRRRIAERIGAAGADAYSLLAVLGHDCVGALQFQPDGADQGPAGAADGPFPERLTASVLAGVSRRAEVLGMAGNRRHGFNEPTG